MSRPQPEDLGKLVAGRPDIENLNYCQSFLTFTHRLRFWGGLLAGTLFISSFVLAFATGSRWWLVSTPLWMALFVKARTVEPAIPLAFDYRPPVLLLRSYQASSLKVGEWGALEGTPGFYRSHVADLCSGLWEWGRVVIVQEEDLPNDQTAFAIVVKPKRVNLTFEWFSDASASIERFETPNVEMPWKPLIHDLMRHSWFIAVWPLHSEGLLWEMKTLAANDELLSKTIVFMPISDRRPNGSSERPDHRPAWMAVQKALFDATGGALDLPDYQDQGLAFVPTKSFGVRKSIPFPNGSLAYPNLSELVAQAPPARVPLKALLRDFEIIRDR